MTLQSNRKSQISNLKSAFTLVELLVVIGIIAVLIGLLVPAVMSAMKGGDRARISSQVAVLALAVDAYKADFGSAPISNEWVGALPKPSANHRGQSGAVVLCRWIVGAGGGDYTGAAGGRRNDNGFLDDFIVGPGYRLPSRTGGEDGVVKQPYVNPGQFRVERYDSANDRTFIIRDAIGNPFFYYNIKSPSATPQSNYVGTASSMYDDDDNTNNGSYGMPGLTTPNQQFLQAYLGDTDLSGTIGAGENARWSSYLIISAGPSRAFVSPTGTRADVLRIMKASTAVSNIPD